MDLLPTLKSAVDVPWFVSIDILGTIAFAISGLVLARRDDYSVFGAVVLATLPAVGGGILRDLIFGRTPVGFTRTPLYLLIILATVGVGYLVMLLIDLLPARAEQSQASRFRRLASNVIEVCDALGLASFIVTGVVVAVEVGAAPIYLWGPVAATLTAAGGGILRDIVRADKENPALKRTFYTEVAVIWGFAFSVYLSLGTSTLADGTLTLVIVATMLGAFLTRLAAVAFGWRSPKFAATRKGAGTRTARQASLATGSNPNTAPSCC